MSNLLLSIDVEASGPCPGRGDLISFGIVVIEPGLTRRFRSPNMLPECSEFDPGAYNAIGMTREQHLASRVSLGEGFKQMDNWLAGLNARRFTMVSDNPAFDFMWMATLSWNKLGYCPFGHSARRIGDCWAGLSRKSSETRSWRKFRKTKHTHDPLDDALGNAEAWQAIWRIP